MATDEDYLFLVRELLAILTDFCAEIGTLRLAVQKHGVSQEELSSCREEVERRLGLAERRERLRGATRESLAEVLKNFQGTVQ